MKVVKLYGGLGNQMFQYAFGRLVSADAYDTSWFKQKHSGVTPRNYGLDFFNISPKILTHREYRKFIRPHKILRLFGVKPKLKNIVEKQTNIYDKNILMVKSGVFDGYFQCAKYYDSVRADLLKDFSPKDTPNKQNQNVLDLIKSTNSVSLHVRRGDYVKLQEIHGLCDMDYYNKAIKFIEGKVKKPYFFVFSDDIDWVKENLKTKHNCVFVDFNHGKDSAWDMILMKNCKHNIIANSSFSWWGAWLNENPDKIVICPKNWFADGTKTDIVPNNWKKI